MSRFAALVAVAAMAGRAAAHSELVSTSVALETADLRANVEAHLTLRFSGAIQARESGVEMVPEHGDAHRLPLVFGPGAGDVAATCPPLPAGRYRLHYHVVAADGHVTEGTVPVRVAPD